MLKYNLNRNYYSSIDDRLFGIGSHLVFFYFTHQEHEVSRVKFYLMGLVCCSLVVLFVDYATRANDSILYKQIIENYLDLLVAVLMYHRGQASID